MKGNSAIGDIMTADIISVNPDDTILIVREKIANNQIHHIPVVNGQKVIGMISLSDIHKMEHHFTMFNNPEAEASNTQIFSTMLAKEIMTTPVISIKESDAVRKAVDLFLLNKFHALPVVNEDDHLVGMVTTFDIIRHSLEK